MNTTKTFTDAQGRKVEIPFPPRRIISTVPSTTEMIVTAGSTLDGVNLGTDVTIPTNVQLVIENGLTPGDQVDIVVMTLQFAPANFGGDWSMPDTPPEFRQFELEYTGQGL